MIKIDSNTKIVALVLALMVMTFLITYKPATKHVIEPTISKPTLPATISLNMSNGTDIVCDIDKANNIECKKLSNLLSSGIEKPVVKRADWGSNGTIGPYGISPDGTPLFDSSVYSPAQVAELQGGYGKGYGVVSSPNPSQPVVINVKDPSDPCKEIHSAVCGVEGPMGCSGNPNPPTEADIWNFNHGIFTPRQGDIMLKDCYNPNNLHHDNMTVLVTDVNGTVHELQVTNDTVVEVG